jgi:membrane-bound metal-dependent hydrolase YbcI (DUF457 family)
MMGGHHAASGAAAWVAVTTTTTGLALIPTDPAGVLTGALVCAGAALLPDLDHRRSTLTRALPPLTSVLARVTERAAGGHRAGTHSILGIVVAVAFAVLLGRTAWGPAVAALLLGALALKALRFIPGPHWAWLIALAAGLAVGMGQPVQGHWFPTAIGLGVAAHIIGDMFTAGGVGLLWPLSRKRFALPFLGKTGSAAEWVVMAPITLYAVYGVLSQAWHLVRG